MNLVEKIVSIHSVDEKIKIKNIRKAYAQFEFNIINKNIKKHANLHVHCQMTHNIQNIIIGFVVVIKEIHFLVFRVYYLVVKRYGPKQ